MILVITHTQEFNEYDHKGRLVAEKGEVFVSHGINIKTGKTVILPCEKWKDFKHQCSLINGEWYLKGN
jgi:hypothetical protein